jgi:hypothetical protein
MCSKQVQILPPLTIKIRGPKMNIGEAIRNKKTGYQAIIRGKTHAGGLIILEHIPGHGAFTRLLDPDELADWEVI